MDLVESVRLMAANEAFVVSAWHGFLQHAQDKVLPACSGRLVKSLGDGLLAEFDRSADAVKAAYAMHRYFDRTNERLPPEARLHLRAGIHATHLYIDTHDVFGHGVNLAARVTALAAPGETVITASVRDTVVDGIDGEVEDMGESYLKHWPEPVRTWRIWPANDTAPVARAAPQSPVHEDLRPTIAVIPFPMASSGRSRAATTCASSRACPPPPSATARLIWLTSRPGWMPATSSAAAMWSWVTASWSWPN
jgi:adenylate cyclase